MLFVLFSTFFQRELHLIKTVADVRRILKDKTLALPNDGASSAADAQSYWRHVVLSSADVNNVVVSFVSVILHTLIGIYLPVVNAAHMQFFSMIVSMLVIV